MTIAQIIILLLIGILAGMLSGFIGVGGGVVVVPALVYFLSTSQHMAQGTSLAMMLPPVGILAVYNYHRAGNVEWKYAVILALTFLIGGYLGSKISLRLSPQVVKFSFGLLALYVSIRMLWVSGKELFAAP